MAYISGASNRQNVEKAERQAVRIKTKGIIHNNIRLKFMIFTPFRLQFIKLNLLCINVIIHLDSLRTFFLSLPFGSAIFSVVVVVDIGGDSVGIREVRPISCVAGAYVPHFHVGFIVYASQGGARARLLARSFAQSRLCVFVHIFAKRAHRAVPFILYTLMCFV